MPALTSDREVIAGLALTAANASECEVAAGELLTGQVGQAGQVVLARRRPARRSRTFAIVSLSSRASVSKKLKKRAGRLPLEGPYAHRAPSVQVLLNTQLRSR